MNTMRSGRFGLDRKLRREAGDDVDKLSRRMYGFEGQGDNRGGNGK